LGKFGRLGKFTDQLRGKLGNSVGKLGKLGKFGKFKAVSRSFADCQAVVHSPGRCGSWGDSPIDSGDDSASWPVVFSGMTPGDSIAPNEDSSTGRSAPEAFISVGSEAGESKSGISAMVSSGCCLERVLNGKRVKFEFL
jgi:hypothetical protein